MGPSPKAIPRHFFNHMKKTAAKPFASKTHAPVIKADPSPKILAKPAPIVAKTAAASVAKPAPKAVAKPVAKPVAARVPAPVVAPVVSAPVAKPVAKVAAKAPKATASSPKEKPAAMPVTTTIVAVVDVGFGNHLTLRGDGPGLSWDVGVPLECAADDRWLITFPESGQPIICKFLINDSVWCGGEDYTVLPGASVVLSPAF